MSYIVIETHGGPEYATICTDENGINLVFETAHEAADCQNGIVVEF